MVKNGLISNGSPKDALNKDEGKVQSSKWYSVDKSMLACKMTIIAYFCGIGSYVPFLNVFLVSIGFTPSQVGFCRGIFSISMILFQPVFSGVADRTGKHKLMLMCMCVTLILCIAPQPFIARAMTPYSGNLVASQAPTNVTQVLLNTSQSNSSLSTTEGPQETVTAGLGSLFYVIVVLTFIGWGCMTSASSFIVGQTLNLVSKSTVGASYGHQRMWGAVAAGIMSAIAGALADKLQHQGYSKYTAVFYTFLFSEIAFLISLPRFYRRDTLEDDIELEMEDVLTKPSDELSNGTLSEDPEARCNGAVAEDPGTECNGAATDDAETESFVVKTSKTSAMEDGKSQVWGLVLVEFKKFSILFHFATILVMGMGNGLLFGYFFMLLEQRGATRSQLGLGMFVAMFAELIGLLFSRAIFQRIGHGLAMLLGIVCMAPRFLLISKLTSVWPMIFTQLIHFATYGIYRTASVEVLHASVPPAIQTTMIGVQSAFYLGFGDIIANMAGGWIYETQGGGRLYEYASYIYVGWSVLFIADLVVQRRRKNKETN